MVVQQLGYIVAHWQHIVVHIHHIVGQVNIVDPNYIVGHNYIEAVNTNFHTRLKYQVLLIDLIQKIIIYIFN